MNRSKIITCLALVAALSSNACVEDEPLTRDFGFAPRSLDGTDIDGAFHYDRQGKFVFDEDARRSFDYFLTTEGELSQEEIDAWVEGVIITTVSPKQQARVRESWYAYVDFRTAAAAALEADAAATAQSGEAEAALLATLDADFGGTPFAAAERQRLTQAFALRAIYDKHAKHAKHAEHADDSEARDQALAALDADEAARFADSRAGRFLAARGQIEAARQAGASPVELQALRVEHFDTNNPGAADRLAALDQRRADWDARVAAYELARTELRLSWIGTPDQLYQALADLATESFTQAELRRVRALSQLAAR